MSRLTRWFVSPLALVPVLAFASPGAAQSRDAEVRDAEVRDLSRAVRTASASLASLASLAALQDLAALSAYAHTAHAAVSAGNTGALMAMSKFSLKTMPEIDRPAIAAVWPTLRGESIVLDVGASIGADA